MSINFKHKVFVYGTLMSGFGNNRLIQEESLYHGKAHTKDKYVMLHLGGFPGVVPVGDTDDGTHIWGEVYHVNDEALQRMDALEGHPDFYKRQEVEVQSFIDESEILKVWMYVFQENRLYSMTRTQIVEGGDWREVNEI